jgi:hypothetical protein
MSFGGIGVAVEHNPGALANVTTARYRSSAAGLATIAATVATILAVLTRTPENGRTSRYLSGMECDGPD